MEAHEELLIWAKGQGVELNGIEPKRIPGRGIGIVTTRATKADEVIMTVPTAALRTLHTVPRSISQKLPKDMTVHGLLAADLALDKSTKYAAWNAVTPTMEDLEGLPLLWDSRLQELLPRRARDLLRKQRANQQRDWALVSEAFPELAADPERYTHAWLLVNTRTFYHVTRRTEKRHKDDHMVLQPVADLFNHSSGGGPDAADDDGTASQVSFDNAGFTIRASRSLAAGEEVHICYGAHSNDFLLLEYGFVLDSNRWDEASLDDALLPALERDPGRRALLERTGFWGGYVLDRGTACYRTEVAARCLCMPAREWRRFLDGKGDGGSRAGQARADAVLAGLLEAYADKVRRDIVAGGLDALGDGVGTEAQRSLLRTRWGQILELLDSAVKRLRG